MADACAAQHRGEVNAGVICVRADRDHRVVGKGTNAESLGHGHTCAATPTIGIIAVIHLEPRIHGRRPVIVAAVPAPVVLEVGLLAWRTRRLLLSFIWVPFSGSTAPCRGDGLLCLLIRLTNPLVQFRRKSPSPRM